jgi:hypothetical protein
LSVFKAAIASLLSLAFLEGMLADGGPWSQFNESALTVIYGQNLYQARLKSITMTVLKGFLVLLNPRMLRITVCCV